MPSMRGIIIVLQRVWGALFFKVFSYSSFTKHIDFFSFLVCF
jgi:hypothetical protein